MSKRSVLERNWSESERDRLTRGFNLNGVAFLIDEMAALSEAVTRMDNLADTGLEGLLRRVQALEAALRTLTSSRADLSSRYVDQINITAETCLDQSDGFYKLEIAKNGEPYRWTGPGSLSTLTLFVDRTKRRTVAINIMNFSMETVSVLPWLDGQRTTWSRVKRGKLYTSHLIELTERDEKLPTLLGFEASEVWDPKTKNPESTDKRMLGVAFHSLATI